MAESIELPRKVGLGEDGDDGVIENGVFELGFLTWFDLEEMERNLRMVRLIGFFGVWRFEFVKKEFFTIRFGRFIHLSDRFLVLFVIII